MNVTVTVDEAKSLLPLQVPSLDIDDGLYHIKSTVECEQHSTDDQIKYRLWFTTPVCSVVAFE